MLYHSLAKTLRNIYKKLVNKSSSHTKQTTATQTCDEEQIIPEKTAVHTSTQTTPVAEPSSNFQLPVSEPLKPDEGHQTAVQAEADTQVEPESVGNTESEKPNLIFGDVTIREIIRKCPTTLNCVQWCCDMPKTSTQPRIKTIATCAGEQKQDSNLHTYSTQVEPSVGNTESEKPILFVGDVTIQDIKLKCPTTFNCLPWSSANDIKSFLKQVKTSRFHSVEKSTRIVLHVGQNDSRFYEQEDIQKNVASLCNFAKLMSDCVVFSGPIPYPSCEKRCSRLSSLNSWLAEWCPRNNVGFVNHWADFSDRPELYQKDGICPSAEGTALLSKNLDDFLEGKQAEQ